MMTVDEFDEQFYLRQNPDVAEAVRKGLMISGFEHYSKFGEKERRPAQKIRTKHFLSRGFADTADRIHFYSLVQRPDFIEMLSEPDYVEALSAELDTIRPQIVLDTLE